MAFVLAVAPFAFLNGNHDPANLPQSVLVQVAGFALAAVALLRRGSIGSSPLDAPILALAGWGLLSVAWALSRAEAVPVALQWLACAAWFAAASRAVEDAGAARTLALALFGSGAAVAAVGLVQHLAGLSAFYQAVPPAATFVHKNIAAQYVMAALPLGLAGFRAWPRAPRLTPSAGLALLAAAVMLMFIALTRTRSAWAAVAVEAMVVAVVVLRAHLPALRAAALLALAAALAAALLVPGVRDRARGLWMPAAPRGWEAAPAFTSAHHRQAIWLNTAAMIADAPLGGVGLGNHKVRYPAYARRVAPDEIMGAEARLDYAHNDPLQLAAETGLVGLALAGWVLVRLRRVARAASAVAPAPLLAAWAAALSGLAIDSLFSFPMQRALPPAIVAVGLGSIAALAGLAPGRLASRASRMAAVAALAAALLSADYGWRAVRADRHVLRMMEAEARGNWPRVRTDAEAALRLMPGGRDALFSLGTAQLALGRLPEARAALKAVLEQHPDDLPALGNLALARAAAGDRMGALELYARVLALDPSDPRAHFGRAEILEQLGATWPALFEFRLAVDLDRGNARYQFRRGLAAERAGSYPEAATALRAAIALEPRFAAAHQALGRVLIQRFGQAAEGEGHLRRAEELGGIG